MSERKPAFAGKSIVANVSGITRGAAEPTTQRDYFIQFYPQFLENLEELDEDTKADFQERGNDVLNDRNIGDSICSGDVDTAHEEL